MDSPINPHSNDDIDEIGNNLEKDTRFKKRFYIVLICLIIAVLAIAIGVTVIVLRKDGNKSDKSSDEQTDKPTDTPIDNNWEELPGNQVYENFECKNGEKDINSRFAQNLWNTPKRGDSRWIEGFQDMNVLVGYPQLKYNSDRTQCTVTVYTKTAIELDLSYIFNNEEQSSNIKIFDSSFKDVLKITVKAKTGEVLNLEDVDFVWNSQALGTTKYDTKGKKGAIVEMYGWKDTDIEKECKFIGEQGYMGVKVFPHHEQLMSHTPFRNHMNPWYFMYQPVSYKLNGRQL